MIHRPFAESVYSRRRKSLQKFLTGHVMVLPTNPVVPSNRDQSHPFQPNSDFLYLTGFREPHSALVLLGQGSKPRSILYVEEREPTKEQWEGERLGTLRAKRLFEVDEVRPIEKLHRDLPNLIKGAHELHFPIGVDPRLDLLLFGEFQSPTSPRMNVPHTIRDARSMISELRWVKDKFEIELLRSAAEITVTSYRELLPRLSTFKTEIDCARELERLFIQHGATGNAYGTIVAAGKNAVTLHHPAGRAKIQKKQLVLIDAGCSLDGYASDISRTVPVDGSYSPAQKVIYEIVLQAHDAVIKRSKPRETLDELHRVSALEITKGLVDAKIIKGSASAAMLAGKYKPFYMHRVGHWLGIDVHDIAPVIDPRTRDFLSAANRPLEPGCVFTVEPGIYIDSRDESVPAEFRGIGVRIENDVVITPHGKDVITGALPTKVSEIEELMRG